MIAQIAISKLDSIIIVAYFILILLFGSVFGRFTKTTKDFFFGGHKFSWWIIAMSCVATLVGSYSFIKYSAAAYSYGFSSSMTYLNDWFIMPLFIFGWLPIIYFSRVTSIPEYFEKRFNKLVRLLGTIFIMLYLIGYIGVNFYTLGVAMQALLGINIYTSVIIIAIVCAIYVTAGGQTAVIMTDLLQGFLLLIAGFVLLFFGIRYLGGFSELWNNLPVSHRTPFSGFNEPDKFPAVGVFWQDAMANSLAFYFMNQGIIMRFLSLKSVKEGRKAICFIVLVLMPLTTLAVTNAGWIGKAMCIGGYVSPEVQASMAKDGGKEVFVIVSQILCKPGIFGIIMAALTAALMSTVDTLINAVSAVFVNDVWKTYVKPNKDDKHYLFTARWFSIVATFFGVLLVPVFRMSGTIYEAHAMFTAAITPPIVIAIILGAFWRRFNSKAAAATLMGGGILILLSFIWEDAILGLRIANIPIFSFGVGAGGYKFTRAFFGLSTCFFIGVIVAFSTKPQPLTSISGYVVDTIKEAKEKFKGSVLTKESTGKKVLLEIVFKDELLEDTVSISKEDMDVMGAVKDDNMYIADERWWLGGLRSIHVKASEPHSEKGKIFLSSKTFENSNLLKNKKVLTEKIM